MYYTCMLNILEKTDNERMVTRPIINAGAGASRNVG